MRRTFSFLATLLLAVAGGTSAIAFFGGEEIRPDEHEGTGPKIESGPGVVCSEIPNYALSYEPNGTDLVIGFSSRDLGYEFNLSTSCTLDMWASWARPYTTIRVTLTNDTSTLVHYYDNVDGPGDFETTVNLEAGSYEARFSVFGVHVLHEFEMGGSFVDNSQQSQRSDAARVLPRFR